MTYKSVADEMFKKMRLKKILLRGLIVITVALGTLFAVDMNFFDHTNGCFLEHIIPNHNLEAIATQVKANRYNMFKPDDICYLIYDSAGNQIVSPMLLSSSFSDTIRFDGAYLSKDDEGIISNMQMQKATVFEPGTIIVTMNGKYVRVSIEEALTLTKDGQAKYVKEYNPIEDGIYDFDNPDLSFTLSQKKF